MTPEEIFEILNSQGVSVALCGNDIRYKTTSGPLLNHLRELIVKHKPELVAYLRRDTQPVLRLFQQVADHLRQEESRPAVRLIQRLIARGYCLYLVPSDSRPGKYTIIPVGEVSADEDLIQDFEAYHDEAAELLLTRGGSGICFLGDLEESDCGETNPHPHH